jgi:hypothetical protein
MTAESGKQGPEHVTGTRNAVFDVSTLEGVAALAIYQQDAREAGDQEA